MARENGARRMAGNFQIRELGVGDIGVLDRVRSDTFDNPIIPEQARAFLGSEFHRIVVALDRGEVVGMATGVIMLHPDKEPAFFIIEVGVHDDYRRLGLGRRLSKALIASARAARIGGIWLATEAVNSAARGLYRDLGGRETEGVVVYDWGGVIDES